jgi:ABC-type branched-subunit amino acid transport system substrate-binding protein
MSPFVDLQDPAWVEQIVGSEAQALLCDAEAVVAGEAVAALRRSGWAGTFLGGPELGQQDFLAVADEAAQGVQFVTPWPRLADLQAGEGFETNYRGVSNGVSPGPLAVVAYEATWVLLEALERDIATHGMPTRDGMAAALQATERRGHLGRISFDGRCAWEGVPIYLYQIGPEGTPEPLP